jgi:hypothetical protein
MSASLERAIAEVEKAAKKYADGHYTVFRFTTDHYKILLGTAKVVIGYEDYWRLFNAPAYPTLEAALWGLLATLPDPDRKLPWPRMGDSE